MIIKYYNDGWNYIDNAERVKWINKRVQAVEQGKDCDATDTMSKGIINVSKTDIDSLKTEIPSEIEIQLKMFNKIYPHFVFYEIDFVELGKLLKRGEDVYIRLISYIRDNELCVVAFIHEGYLLNDNGQTIENIGFGNKAVG